MVKNVDIGRALKSSTDTLLLPEPWLFGLFPLTPTKVLYVVGGAIIITYALFQKHLLPLPISKVVSKLFFYPTFPLTALMRMGNYWTKVDETLYLGCAPLDILNHPSCMHNMGIRGVLNMCYEYSGPKHSYDKLGIKQLHFTVCDHTEVPVENLVDAVAFINQYRDRGEKVLVHCKAGHGRGASVALAWMMHEHPDMPVEELNDILKRRRNVRSKLFKQSNIRAYQSILHSRHHQK